MHPKDDMSRIDEVLAAARSRLHRLPADEVPAALERGALLVDIRPAAQRAAEGEVAGALVIERNVLEWRCDPTSAARLPQAVGDDVEWVILCSEGYTSSLAAAALLDLGLHRATDVVGGYHALVAAGDSQDKARQYRERGIRLPTTVETANWYMGLNWLDPVVGKGATPEQEEKNRKLRQAISIVFDWEEYVAVFENSQASVAQGPVPPGVLGFRDLPEGVNPVVYDLVDGKPVITFWGFVNLNENAREDVLDCLRASLLPVPMPLCSVPRKSRWALAVLLMHGPAGCFSMWLT